MSMVFSFKDGSLLCLPMKLLSQVSQQKEGVLPRGGILADVCLLGTKRGQSTKRLECLLEKV